MVFQLCADTAEASSEAAAAAPEKTPKPFMTMAVECQQKQSFQGGMMEALLNKGA
jgi:hypothetical protein